MMATSLSGELPGSGLVSVESMQPSVPVLCNLTLPDLPSSLGYVHIIASNGLRDRYERFQLTVSTQGHTTLNQSSH